MAMYLVKASADHIRPCADHGCTTAIRTNGNDSAENAKHSKELNLDVHIFDDVEHPSKSKDATNGEIQFFRANTDATQNTYNARTIDIDIDCNSINNNIIGHNTGYSNENIIISNGTNDNCRTFKSIAEYDKQNCDNDMYDPFEDKSKQNQSYSETRDDAYYANRGRWLEGNHEYVIYCACVWCLLCSSYVFVIVFVLLCYPENQVMKLLQNKEHYKKQQN